MIAWAATPNASFADFWSSSEKSTIPGFVGLKTSCWSFCLAVASDWVLMYFL